MNIIDFNERARQNARNIARHEAGHYVVARSLGFQTIDFEVSRETLHYRRDFFTGRAQVVTIRDCGINGDVELETYLKQRIMVLNAGALAEAFDGSTVDERRLQEIRESNGADDDAKAKELFSVYLNQRIGQGRDREFSSSELWGTHPFWLECDRVAVDILRENWTAIDKIVARTEQVLHRCDVYACTAEQLEAIAWDDAAPHVA